MVPLARRNVLLAEQTVRDNEDALLQLIGQFEFNTTLGDVKFTDQAIPAISFDHSYELALNNAPDYASAKALVEQLKLDARVAKNNAMPSLDLGVPGSPRILARGPVDQHELRHRFRGILRSLRVPGGLHPWLRRR